MELTTGPDGLEQLITSLRRSGLTVVGPTVRDGVIMHAEISAVADLPRGWADDQQPGAYRLTETGSDALFGFSSPSESWKRFVFPPRTLLIRAHRSADGISIEEPKFDDEQSLALFGIRSCDLAGLRVLDRVLLTGSPDPMYVARRNETFIVAVGCSAPASTCFCASMDTGPTPTAGFDLAIVELHDSDPPRYLISTGSERGATVLAVIDGEVPSKADRTRASEQHDAAVASMTRTIDPADPPRAAQNLEHPQWAAVAERCLACGNCTMVCPTCFCSTTEESTSLDGATSERTRVWDSCFTLDFTQMHGGSVRTSTESRYRQWLLHKLVTWHDQFDVSGCVGCGRCITWCPVGIDLTAEIATLAAAQASEAAATS